MSDFLALARTPAIAARAFRVALVIGTVLTLINQGDHLIAGMAPDWIKMILTYMVPYCVSTHGAVSAMQASNQQTLKE